MGKEYFDLHLHAIVKNFLTKYEEKLPSIRDARELRGEVELSRGFMRLIDETALHLLRSQGSF